jgi:hypothetical protein
VPLLLTLGCSSTRETGTSAVGDDDLGGTQITQRFELVHGRVHGKEETAGQKVCTELDMDGKHGKDGNVMVLTLGSLISCRCSTRKHRDEHGRR